MEGILMSLLLQVLLLKKVNIKKINKNKKSKHKKVNIFEGQFFGGRMVIAFLHLKTPIFSWVRKNPICLIVDAYSLRVILTGFFL